MKNRIKSDQKNYVLLALCAIVLVMAVGYAAFNSLLTINGTASLTSSFCVGFDNTKLNTYTTTTGISGGTAPTGSMSYSGTACSTKYVPNSTLSSTFHQPGDKIEYTLTIANKSTFTVAIKSILVENQSVTSNTTITKGNVKYIVEMPLSTTLASNAETTMKVTAMFQNDTPVTGAYAGETQTLNVKINAEQDDGSGGFTPTPTSFTGTLYRNNTIVAITGSSIVAGEKYIIENGSTVIPMGPYDTQGECQTALGNMGSPSGFTCEARGIGSYTTNASTLNSDYYLKHDVVSDIITASYACFVYDNVEHCMKGGDSGASFATNTSVIQDYQSFYSISSGCSFDSNNSSCYGSGNVNYVAAQSGGYVAAGDSYSVLCDVDYNGISSCKQS